MPVGTPLPVATVLAAILMFVIVMFLSGANGDRRKRDAAERDGVTRNRTKYRRSGDSASHWLVGCRRSVDTRDCFRLRGAAGTDVRARDVDARRKVHSHAHRLPSRDRRVSRRHRANDGGICNLVDVIAFCADEDRVRSC